MSREGYVLAHPNRDSAASKWTRIATIVLLLISAALIVLITVGGWAKLEGTQAIQLIWAGLYLLFAFMVLRWRRGALPLAAALAIGMAIFALVAAPQWFARDKPGFESPAFDEAFLGLLTYLVIPVQVLLIAVAARGFTQGWNVEEEVPIDDLPPGERRRERPATA